MHVTGDISLGSIAIIVTLIGVTIRIGMQIGNIQAVASSHETAIARHAARLDLYEGRLVSVVSDVQRLIGRVEATQDRIERQTGTRSGEGKHP